MKNEFTAVIEKGDDDRWWVATCPEVPGTVGQGLTPDEAREDLASAVELMLAYLRDRAMEGADPAAQRSVLTVG